MPRTRLAALLLASACLATPAFAADKPAEAPKADAPKPDAAEGGQAGLLPADSITRHRLTIGGRTIAYTAHAGTLSLRDDDGKPGAKVFYVAYTQDGAAAQNRPVSFFFNGGPGAGTAYLNLGAAGPRMLEFPADQPTDGGAAHLADNPDSWLPATDMVFIDAVGTGYSRPIDPHKAAAAYYGVTKDGGAFAKAIELWVGQNGRQASPHYLVGESYGGIRSIQVAWQLQQQQNLIVNGIVMISPAIQMQFLDTANNPVASAMTLPTFIAAHLDATHQLTPAAVDDAYRYAFGPYLTTLANTPPQGADAQKFYAEVARRTGLPEAVVAKQRGALDPMSHDVRSRDGRLYGLYDFTQSIADPYPEGIDNNDSPEMTLSGFGRAYGNAFAGYAANELGFRTELTYDLLSMEVNGAWGWGDKGSPMTDQVALLRKLLALDPGLHIFVANGYFDMACPFGTTRWTRDHIPVGADRIGLHIYPGGHMLYTRPESRAALWHDVEGFYTAAQAPRSK
ncbi:peptidase S10 [Gluconacetobacter azotocaptans]|uniref:S10 family peptidase n=1 Tax=Gluconacetobacter azotocaptans TaxID=142834 RepID=UPI001957BF93|nr:peptidase S10 [Gluconacetobacter azotocaptans]MBM9402035.1 peptidase S10 [Gluconacetobacter azotocaptans]